MKLKHLLFYVSSLACVLVSGMAQAQTIPAAPNEMLEFKQENGQSIVLRRNDKAEQNIQLANCNISINSTQYGGPLAIGDFTQVYGPYTTRCSGTHRGVLSNLSNAWLNLLLQKQVSGSWQTVSNSTYTLYSGSPGTYRWLVTNTGGGSGNWKIDFGIPL